MEIVIKCVFLKKVEGTKRNGDSYKQLKFVDKKNMDNITVFCSDFGKYDKMQPYTDCDVTFNLYKDKQGNYQLALVGD